MLQRMCLFRSTSRWPSIFLNTNAPSGAFRQARAARIGERVYDVAGCHPDISLDIECFRPLCSESPCLDRDKIEVDRDLRMQVARRARLTHDTSKLGRQLHATQNLPQHAGAASAS